MLCWITALGHSGLFCMQFCCGRSGKNNTSQDPLIKQEEISKQQTKVDFFFSNLNQNAFFFQTVDKKKNKIKPQEIPIELSYFLDQLPRQLPHDFISEGTACQRDCWQGTMPGSPTAKQQCVPLCNTECCYWVSDAAVCTLSWVFTPSKHTNHQYYGFLFIFYSEMQMSSCCYKESFQGQWQDFFSY